MFLERLQLEYRLKEFGITKLELAKKIGITPMTLHNKFSNPQSFKVNELQQMVRCGFIKNIIIEL
tara:strand:- start:178 stop:372 length:195 start_codon:yes stop_codon:yes gene_type:complete